MPRLRSLAVALLALVSLQVVGGCSPCAAAVEVHKQQCQGGDVESCEWLSQHDTGIVGVCAP